MQLKELVNNGTGKLVLGDVGTKLMPKILVTKIDFGTI